MAKLRSTFLAASVCICAASCGDGSQTPMTRPQGSPGSTREHLPNLSDPSHGEYSKIFARLMAATSGSDACTINIELNPKAPAAFVAKYRINLLRGGDGEVILAVDGPDRDVCYALWCSRDSITIADSTTRLLRTLPPPSDGEITGRGPFGSTTAITLVSILVGAVSPQTLHDRLGTKSEVSLSAKDGSSLLSALPLETQGGVAVKTRLSQTLVPDGVKYCWYDSAGAIFKVQKTKLLAPDAERLLARFSWRLSAPEVVPRPAYKELLNFLAASGVPEARNAIVNVRDKEHAISATQLADSIDAKVDSALIPVGSRDVSMSFFDLVYEGPERGETWGFRVARRPSESPICLLQVSKGDPGIINGGVLIPSGQSWGIYYWTGTDQVLEARVRNCVESFIVSYLKARRAGAAGTNVGHSSLGPKTGP